MRDATVSDFFYKESKSKRIKKGFFLFFLCWGGAVVGERGYSRRISLNKNPNVNKKMWGGGECGGGAGEVGAGESFLYESKFKIIPGG